MNTSNFFLIKKGARKIPKNNLMIPICNPRRGDLSRTRSRIRGDAEEIQADLDIKLKGKTEAKQAGTRIEWSPDLPFGPVMHHHDRS